MPELPEVEVTRLSLADRIAGARIEAVRLGSNSLVGNATPIELGEKGPEPIRMLVKNADRLDHVGLQLSMN